MKIVLVSLMMAALLGCQSGGDKKVVLATRMDSVSYSFGINIGKNLGRDSITVNPDALAKGIMDAVQDSAHRLMSEPAMEQTVADFQEEVRMKQMERMRNASTKNKSVGETFLEANRKRPGVTTLPSGLQYEVIAEGNGKKPTLDQTVTINYRGTLVDGTEFDSSYKRGEPATFPINQLIEGWKQALQLMPVGSHWRVYVPSSLAYGERGQGNLIGPNATLIFEIELLAIR